MTDSKKSSNDQILIELYNEIDAFLRQQHKGDRYADHNVLIMEVSKKNSVVARHQQKMRAIGQIRNSLVHNPFGSGAHPVTTPHDVVIEVYEGIRNELINPPNALSIAIPGSQIFTATLEDNLISVIKKMNDQTYTHIPIIEDGVMFGILSENTLLSYLADKEEIIITKDLKIGELKEYIPLDKHRSEIFSFLSRNSTLSQVYELFNKAIAKHQRIGMIFITEHGKQEESLVGIITAWDLASPSLGLN